VSAWLSDAEARASDGYATLAIAERHVWGTLALPFHHRDPFDRLLIAQAIDEELTLLSVDRALARYPVTLAWADRSARTGTKERS